jgi:hypothetical protein
MAGPSVIETKVVASSWTAVLTGTTTWALVTYVPIFKSGIPGPLDTFLPFMVAALLSTIAGYFAKHTPRQEETVRAAFQVFNDPKVLAEMEKFVRTEEGQATLRAMPTGGGEHVKE